MARTKSAEKAKDPATGRPLTLGVEYRGVGQYRARKLIAGKRVAQTFETDRRAKDWLQRKEVEVDDGTFVDRSSLDKVTLSEVIQRFVDANMQVGGKRRGAAEDLGHIPALRDDDIGKLKLGRLKAARVEAFKERQEEAGYAPGTIVKRLNLLSTIMTWAIRKFEYPMENPASTKAVPRPKGADIKRDRRLEAPKPSDIRAAVERGGEPPRHEEAILLEYVGKSKYSDDLHVTRLVIAQAMRQGEIIALRLCDIDFDGKRITVRGVMRSERRPAKKEGRRGGGRK